MYVPTRLTITCKSIKMWQKVSQLMHHQNHLFLEVPLIHFLFYLILFYFILFFFFHIKLLFFFFFFFFFFFSILIRKIFCSWDCNYFSKNSNWTGMHYWCFNYNWRSLLGTKENEKLIFYFFFLFYLFRLKKVLSVNTAYLEIMCGLSIR